MRARVLERAPLRCGWGLADEAAGGHDLRAASLSFDLFKAEAMRAVDKDLMAMKVDASSR